MPSVSASTFSTLAAASSVRSSEVPFGIVWVTDSVPCPLMSRKLVFSSGAIAIVPTKTAIPARMVSARNRVVKRMIGTYARCSGLRRSARSAFSLTLAWACSLASAPCGRFRNQYANTGMMVSDTSSEASNATVAVTANGRNSSPTSSPTNASGRNTATVARVEEVIAPATSRTPARIASRFSSP